ncbi:MAG: choice-of-anchor R domain-containing protein [Verrucomicrobiota bacterium]
MAYATASTLPAAVVIDNIAAGTQGFSTGVTGPTAGFGIFTIPDNQTAFTFTSGPVADTLLSLDVVINSADNSSPILATLSTGPNVPGGNNSVTIGSVTPATATGITTVTFSPTNGIALDPSTTYWIHFTVPSGSGNYTALHSNTPNESFGYALNNPWQLPTIGGWSELTSGIKPRIRMTTAIPEPSAALLASLSTFFLLRRKRTTA